VNLEDTNSSRSRRNSIDFSIEKQQIMNQNEMAVRLFPSKQ
jgi:hypothetical protein